MMLKAAPHRIMNTPQLTAECYLTCHRYLSKWKMEDGEAQTRVTQHVRHRKCADYDSRRLSENNGFLNLAKSLKFIFAILTAKKGENGVNLFLTRCEGQSI
jgi:hypothetical protein